MTNHGEPAPNPDRAALERAYREALYSVELPGGTVTFRIGERLPDVEPFALITAWNPGHARPGDVENAAANARLRYRLTALSLRFVAADGRSPDGAHVEPSFAVFGISREAGLALAREFGQAAIAWFDGDAVELAWTSSPHPEQSA
ncbi:MAG: DUF3293 domain-containing protein [Dehalococcoidia bacterium]|nr:DUF3293 domain-containing protein [Dehalococcoidia bacterium]